MKPEVLNGQRPRVGLSRKNYTMLHTHNFRYVAATFLHTKKIPKHNSESLKIGFVYIVSSSCANSSTVLPSTSWR